MEGQGHAYVQRRELGCPYGSGSLELKVAMALALVFGKFWKEPGMVLSNCDPWARWRKYARKCVFPFQPVIGLGPDVSPTLNLALPLLLSTASE